MNYFNPTISNVFNYADMAGQIERLNDKQSAGLRNAVNQAVDVYKFKKLRDEQKKKAEQERRQAMSESVGAKNTDWQTYDEYLANTGYTPIQEPEAYMTTDEFLDEGGLDSNIAYGGLDRSPVIVAVQPYQTGRQAAFEAAQKAKRGRT